MATKRKPATTQIPRPGPRRGRPRLLAASSKFKVLSIRVDRATWANLHKAAKVERAPLSMLARDILCDYLNNIPPQDGARNY